MTHGVSRARRNRPVRQWALICACMLLWFLMGKQVIAQSRLAEFLAQIKPSELMPEADRFGPIQGQPPIAPALAGSRQLGYVYVNADWVNSTGYSGRPIQILIGLANDGRITGARLMDHHEPIVLVGIPPAKIANFINGYIGRNALEIARAGPSTRPAVDIVSGATVTVTVIADGIIRSAIRVARATGLDPSATATRQARRSVDPNVALEMTWQELTGDGSVRR